MDCKHFICFTFFVKLDVTSYSIISPGYSKLLAQTHVQPVFNVLRHVSFAVDFWIWICLKISEWNMHGFFRFTSSSISLIFVIQWFQWPKISVIAIQKAFLGSDLFGNSLMKVLIDIGDLLSPIGMIDFCTLAVRDRKCSS